MAIANVEYVLAEAPFYQDLVTASQSEECKNAGVPLPWLAAIIMVESSGRPDVVTSAGYGRRAVGLMQVIAKSKGFEERPTEEELKEPVANIREGCKILRYFGSNRDIVTALYRYSGGRAWASWERFDKVYLEKVVRWAARFSAQEEARTKETKEKSVK